LECARPLRACAVTRDGSPSIDRHLNQSGDIAYVDGHYYAAKSPGLATFSLPLYLAYRFAGVVPKEPATKYGPPGAHLATRRAIWMVNLVSSRLSSRSFYSCARLPTRVSRTGTPVAVMLGLGTMCCPSQPSTSHISSRPPSPSRPFVLLSKRRNRRASRRWWRGALAGLAVFTEMPLFIVGCRSRRICDHRSPSSRPCSQLRRRVLSRAGSSGSLPTHGISFAAQ